MGTMNGLEAVLLEKMIGEDATRRSGSRLSARLADCGRAVRLFERTAVRRLHHRASGYRRTVLRTDCITDL